MDFEGPHYVEFTNGEVREIDILHVMMHSNGFPLTLMCADGKCYNWMNVISLWKKP